MSDAKIFTRGLPVNPMGAFPDIVQAGRPGEEKKRGGKRRAARVKVTQADMRARAARGKGVYAISESGANERGALAQAEGSEQVVSVSAAEERNFVQGAAQLAKNEELEAAGQAPAKIDPRVFHAATHGTLQAFARARFAAKGVTLDNVIDTLEDARIGATLPKSQQADHRTRIRAAHIEASMMGVAGPSATREQVDAGAALAGTISTAEAMLTGAALWAQILRKQQAAMSGVSIDQIPIVVFDADNEEAEDEAKRKGILLPVERAQSGREIQEGERQARLTTFAADGDRS